MIADVHFRDGSLEFFHLLQFHLEIHILAHQEALEFFQFGEHLLFFIAGLGEIALAEEFEHILHLLDDQRLAPCATAMMSLAESPGSISRVSSAR